MAQGWTTFSTKLWARNWNERSHHHAGQFAGPGKFIDNRGEKPDELYNLDGDPKEKNNVIKAEKTRAERMHRRLWEFQARWSAVLSWRDKPAESR